ncbi:MAG TPA: hypothetical protein VIK65_04965 [Candidatus Limnocylindrales bacterium]|jgi:hypothetical protein
MTRRTIAALGGLSLITSAVLFVATLAVWSTGGTVGVGTIGERGIGGVVLLGAIALAAIGLATTGLVGPRPFDGRTARAGLCILAFGLASLEVSSLIALTLTYDPLEHWPSVVTLLGGMLGLVVGAPVTVLAFLKDGGASRRLALMFLGGLVLVLVGGNVVLNLFMNGAVQGPAQLVYFGGLVALILGVGAMTLAFAGIGWLAIAAGRRMTAATI